MTTARVILAVVPFMRQAAAHLGMTTGLYRIVGTLEVTGSVGLLLGLTSVPLGVAAAAVVHLRHGDPPARALPATGPALAAVACAGAAVAVGWQAAIRALS